MHAVAAFFASIVTFVSGFFAPPLASNSPPDIRASQPAAAAVAQAEIIGDPFNDPDAASAVAAIIPANAPAPAFSPPPAQTVINQPVIERIIERVVPQGSAGISADTLTAILTDFGQSIEARLAAINPPKADIPQQVAAAGNSGVSGFFPASQRIDQLSNTAITAPTITGGAISGASSVGASSGSFDALSAGTLALSGTLTGTDASFSGTLSAGILNVAGLSSQGALTGPYFTATSTTATSTFAGAVSVSVPSQTNRTTGYQITGSDGNGFVISNFGNSSNLFVGNVVGTNATGSIGYYNTIFGLNSGANIVSAPNGYANSFFGHSAGRDTSSGYGNTFIGNNAGLLNSTGLNNIVLGVNAGNNLTTGSNNIIIGANASAPSATGDSQLNIGNTLYGNLALGNVGIGTTTPWGKLSVQATDNSSAPQFIVSSSTATSLFVGSNGNVGIGTTSPSARLDVGGYGAYDLGFTPSNAIRLFDNYNGISDISIKNISTNITAASAFQAFDSGGSYVSLAMPGTGNTAAPLFGLARASTTYLFSNTVGVNPARNLAIGTLGANSLTLGTNNTARVAIDSSGSVGIGTTSPTNKLEVAGNTFLGGTITGTSTLALTGTTGTTTIAAGQGFTIGTSQFVLQQGSGNVGIGTATPSNALTLVGDASTLRTLEVHNAYAVAADLYTHADATFRAPTINLYRSGGTQAVPTAVQNGFQLGYLQTYGYDGSSYAGASTGIQSTATENWTPSAHGSMLQFNVTPNGAASSIEVMRLANTGNVGIGTTTPWGKLSIKGSGTGTGLAFAVADSADTPRFSVLDNGKVGIGTTTPQANLHIVQGGATDAILSIEQNVSGTNDPLLRFIIPTVANTWVMGTDNSDSDKFKIARNTIFDGTREYWTLDTAGNVGIGTTTPQQKLAISSSGDTRLVIDSSGSGSQSILSFQNQGVAKFEIKNQPSGGSQFLSIGRYGGNDLNVDNNGNVGIGTTTPNAELHIANSTSYVTEQIESTHSSGNAILTLKNPGNTWGIGVRNDTSAASTSLTFLGSGEPPRVCRRLQLLRDWGHGNEEDVEELFT